MGTRIDVQTDGSWNADSQAWIANRKGMDTCRTITLDLALFDGTNHAPDGFIPSGTVLAKVTATGKYGPYDTAGAGGLEVATGHLFDSVNMSVGDTHDVVAALFWEGIVRTAKLPAFSGTAQGELDVDARTALVAFIRYEDN